MNNTEPAPTDSGRCSARAKFTRTAFASGFGFVAILGAVTFYVVETLRLSRFFGGFKGMEVARPTGYPGFRWFVIECTICAAIAACFGWQFFRAYQRIRDEKTG